MQWSLAQSTQIHYEDIWKLGGATMKQLSNGQTGISSRGECALLHLSKHPGVAGTGVIARRGQEGDRGGEQVWYRGGEGGVSVGYRGGVGGTSVITRKEGGPGRGASVIIMGQKGVGRSPWRGEGVRVGSPGTKGGKGGAIFDEASGPAVCIPCLLRLV